MNLLEISIKPDLWTYFLLAVIGSLIVRLVLTVFTTLETKLEESEIPFFDTFVSFFVGKGVDGNRSFDHFQTFVLGVMELSIFPILLIANNPEYIGGWLALKTLPQWNKWTQKRWIYNRFLLGNAFIIAFSYFIARWANP